MRDKLNQSQCIKYFELVLIGTSYTSSRARVKIPVLLSLHESLMGHEYDVFSQYTCSMTRRDHVWSSVEAIGYSCNGS